MLSFIGRLFAWWNGATLGTLWTISKGGQKVGEDDFGNVYYEERKGTGADGKKRRWVIYNGYADASRIPSDWHGWLHYTFDECPADQPLKRQKWEIDHIPNLTGTLYAYRPTGSLAIDAKRQSASSDYESWRPDAS